MAEIKLFRLNGQVEELISKSVTVEKELQNKNVFKLKTDFSLPKRNIGICFLKNTAPSPAVVKLIEMLS